MSNRFSNGFPGELLPLEFDYMKSLNSGETLVGPATVSLAVVAGTDPHPEAILSGSQSISGAIVTLDVTPLVSKVDYRFWVRCPTSNPRKVLVCEGFLYVN